MMDPALRRKLKELEVKALRLVDSRFMGEWMTNMRGQGLEFRDLREYVPGDDVRRLDWKATARSGKAQLRCFNEDRQQTIWLVLDLSASMAGAKARLAQEMLAVLAWAAVKQGDRFGMAGFTDRVEIHRMPARGEAQLWAALEDVLGFEPESVGTGLPAVWEFFLRRETRRSTIILISDFWSGLQEQTLAALAARHEILALQVLDPLELGGVDAGLALHRDPETGEQAWMDLSGTRSGRTVATVTEAERNRLRIRLRSLGVWYSWFRSDEDFMPGLLDFFRRREAVLGA